MSELAAILRVEEWARAAMTLNQEGIRDGSASLAVLPAGVDVKDLEIYAEHRRRFRGTFATSSVAAWVAYIQAIAAADPFRAGLPCFIDAEKASSLVVLDLLSATGKPGHCQNSASVRLKPTALWAALLKLDGQEYTQRAMTDLLGDWRTAWTAYSAGGLEPLAALAALAALRQIDIKAQNVSGAEVDNMSESRSAFATVEATSRSTLPGSFYFTVRPYAELEERTVIADLHVIPNEKAPTLKLRLRERDAILEAIAEEFGGVVELALAGSGLDVLPVIGAFTS